MNDELPDTFRQLTPRGAPAELRGRVLAAVNCQLADQSGATAASSSSADRAPVRPRWERMFEWTVAASLVLGVGLNVWQQRADDAWQTRVYGPLPVSRAMADVIEAVASVTDVETGQWVQQRLSDSRPPRRHADPLRNERYERLFHDLTDSKTDRTL